MSDTGSEPGARQSEEDTPGSAPRKMHWSFVVIPAAAFVIGLVIGGLVIGAGSDGGGEPSASETVTVSPSPNESADTAVVVPRECIQAAETAQQATQLIRDNLSAIQEFQGQRIVDMLNQLEGLSKQANDQAESCSDIEVSASDGASATP